MPVIIGVDGGQSTTLALVASLEGRILGEASAGPSNHIHELGGMERLDAALRGSVMRALQAAAAESEAVSAVCLGMTGGARQAADIAASLFPSAVVHGFDDMVTALAGAAAGQPGVVVIAGTGSVAYGRTADAREAKAGGWGYLLGDEGSGYDIGCAALRAVCQAADGRGAHTRLSEDVLVNLKCADLAQLHHRVYSGALTRPQMAGLASVVGAAAGAGDAVAERLLTAAGHSLALMAWAVLEKLNDYQLPVYTTGGVFRAGRLLLDGFETALRDRSASISAQPAAFSPGVGALFLALKAAGVTLTESIIENVRASLPLSAIAKQG